MSDPGQKPRLDSPRFPRMRSCLYRLPFLRLRLHKFLARAAPPFVRFLQFIAPASHFSCSTIQSEEVNIASHHLGRLKKTFAFSEIALYNALHVIAAVKSGRG